MQGIHTKNDIEGWHFPFYSHANIKGIIFYDFVPLL